MTKIRRRLFVPTDDYCDRMQLIPIREVIEGNSIVVCEDSIVRGTQVKNFTIKKLWDCGATEIDVRPACPPLMFPCRFNLSTSACFGSRRHLHSPMRSLTNVRAERRIVRTMRTPPSAGSGLVVSFVRRAVLTPFVIIPFGL
jgi:hypothetical protein